MRFIDLSAVWCMEPRAAREYLRVYAGILARKKAGVPLDKVAVEAAMGGELGQSSGYEMQGNVAVIPVQGALVKHGDLLSEVSGTPSVEGLRRSLDGALADPKVSGVIFDFDSPGGQIDGINDFAHYIQGAKGTKPIKAFADGNVCSAAYWLAAATDEIVVSQTGVAGSIGCMVGWDDNGKLKESLGIEEVEFISSQSPLKNPAHDSKEGKAYYQSLVDDSAQVFIDAVAEFRGVSSATVQKEYGGGGLFVGASGVKAGLVDRVGTLDGLVAEMQTASKKIAARQPQADKPKSKEQTMGLLENWMVQAGWKAPEVEGRAEETLPPLNLAAAAPPALLGISNALPADVQAKLDELDRLKAAQKEAEDVTFNANLEAFKTKAVAKIPPAALKSADNASGLDLDAMFAEAHAKGTTAHLDALVSAFAANPLAEPLARPTLAAVPRTAPSAVDANAQADLAANSIVAAANGKTGAVNKELYTQIPVAV